jgi:hypothetical protein
MANLLSTTVNGALSASGRISVTYNTDRYQFNFNRTSASDWWVTNDSTALGLHVNNVGDKFYFSTAGDFYSDTNGWLSTALAAKQNASTAITTSNIGSQSVSYASTSGTFSTDWTNYKGVTENAVAGQLMWKNYGNNHTIFDASNSTSPTGSAVNNTNSDIAWTGTYPTLMGWNGVSTYGVRVDSARVADSAGSATTAGSLTSMNISQFTNNSGYITSVGNITRLWAESHPTDYYVRANWTGSYWQLTSNHPSPVQVGYADSAGSAGSLTSMNISQFTNNSGYITSSASISGNAASATFARRIAGPERIGFDVGGDASTFYPIAISTGAGSTESQYSEFVIERGGYDDPGYTGIGFSTFNARFTYKPSGWGYGAVYFNLEQLTQTATMLGDYLDQYQSSQAIIWLRGATRYNIYSVYGGIGLIFTNESGTSYTMAYGTYDPISTPREKATTAKYYDSTVRYAGTIYTGSNAVIHAGNIGSQSVASASNASTVAGLAVHTGRNNEANKIVRTDVNAHLLTGWINTTSGAFSSAINKIYCSDDDYVRYQTPANFISNLGLITTSNIGSQSVTYATSAGSAGSATNATNSDNAGHLRTAYNGDVQTNPQQYFNNTIGLKAAMTGAWNVWSDTLWINGYSGGDVLQMCALHTMRNGTPRMAISVQASTATSYGTFYEVITGYNIASQSVSNADTVDGFHAAVAGTANTIPTRNASGYLIPENWIQLNGIYGLYSPTNSAHLRPNDGSYGSWLVTGSRNGWRGFEFDSGTVGNVSLMVSINSNTVGFHNNSYGWQFYWEGGTLYVAKNTYGGGTNATVLDSVNYTSYAAAASGNTGNEFGARSFFFPATTFNPSTAARDGLSSMSIKMWNNYFNGTGLGSDYGTVMEYYSLSGHVDSQVYFDAGGGSWYRTASYASGFGGWQQYITSANFTTWAQEKENQRLSTTSDVTHNSTTSPTFLVNNHSDNTKGYRIHNTSGTSVSAMFTNSSNQLVIAAGAVDQINLNKNVLVNAVALGVNFAPSATAGRIDASNDIVAFNSSDERLKENITPIANALDKVKSLTGVEFDWKPEHKEAHGHEGRDTGIIAQQVLAVMPTAVRTNDTGYLAVRYEKLIGLLIEGMKEQQTQIDELKTKLDGLTK